MCNDCASLTLKIYKHDTKKNSSFIKPEKLNVKRKFSFTPVKLVKRKCLTFTPKCPTSAPVKSIKIKTFKKEEFKDKVCRYIKDLHYDYALRIMIKKSKRARDALKNVLKRMIKKEVKNVNIPSLKIPSSVKSLQEFQWQRVMREASHSIPLLTGLLQGSFSCRWNKNVYMLVK